jgi:hypothetical protein
MHFMFGDESDREQGRGQKYFVYGAIFVRTNYMQALHKSIEQARKAAGLADTDSLKSATTRDQSLFRLPRIENLRIM